MAPARQQPAQQFHKDEKVLCFHMDMLYEAKIMDVQAGEKPGDGYRYKVHYKGWKNTWDDWVLADRIRPFDDEHKELAAQLHANLKSSTQKSTRQLKKPQKSGGESSRGSEERGSAAVQGGRGGRRGKDWELEQVSLSLIQLSNITCSLSLRPLLLCCLKPWVVLHSRLYIRNAPTNVEGTGNVGTRTQSHQKFEQVLAAERPNMAGHLHCLTLPPDLSY